MKTILRIYLGILSLLYIFLICTEFIWWFIPYLLFGISEKVILDSMFNYMYCFARKYQQQLNEQHEKNPHHKNMERS